jgi:hypothetical protein
MPVASSVRLPSGHHNHVADPGRNLLLAAWADVGLASLKGVKEPHLELGARLGFALARAARLVAHGLILA